MEWGNNRRFSYLSASRISNFLDQPPSPMGRSQFSVISDFNKLPSNDEYKPPPSRFNFGQNNFEDMVLKEEPECPLIKQEVFEPVEEYHDEKPSLPAKKKPKKTPKKPKKRSKKASKKPKRSPEYTLINDWLILLKKDSKRVYESFL